MRSAFKLSCLLVLFGLLISACSETVGPASPQVSGEPPLYGAGQVADPPAVPQTREDPTSQSPGHYLWAYHQILVDLEDPEGIKMEIIPVRLVAGHLNVLGFLEQGPCLDCVALTGITPSGSGTILVDVEITHPFPLLNFTGFDVRGIAMFSGVHLFPESAVTTSDRAVGDGELVNADGFTTLYNFTTEGSGPDGLQGYIDGKLSTPEIPTALLNGYKRHITEIPANIRNAFYAGESITATYEIDMPDGSFVLGYAVDASWVQPTTKPVTDPMTHFPPEANCPEPWNIEVADTPIGLGLTEMGGVTVLTIDVYDWQGKSSHPAPLVECPELFTGAISAVWTEDGVGFSRYELTVENENLAALGEYKCLVAVEDNENATSPDWLDLTAYQVYMLEVVEWVSEPPIAAAGFGPLPQTVCEPVNFFDDGSYDPDGGAIAAYQWDWENDGVFDESGIDVYHTWNTPGTYYVQFKVTDNEATSDELDSPLEVVIENALPTAVAEASKLSPFIGETVVFDASSSLDNDCGGMSIVLYEWDWENDGVFDDVGVSAPAHWYSSGLRNVQLRVTDDEGETDLLDEPLEIYVVNGWARTWGGIEAVEATAVATDTLGNIYVTGHYRGLVDLDPGVETTPGNSQGETDVYLSKFTPEGDLVWSRSWGGSGVDRGFGIAVDSDANAYIVGDFHYGFDFDPGGGTELHTSEGASDVFVSKFDSDGVFQWAKTWGGIGWEGGHGIAVYDAWDDVYVTGYFSDVVDFDPGPGVDSNTSNGWHDVFMVKLDSDGLHQLAWTWGGTSYDQGRGVSVDSTGDAYFTGYFRVTVDFDPEPDIDNHISNGLEDVFLSKFDGSIGFCEWTRTWGGSSEDVGDEVLANQLYGEVYVTGWFTGSVDFDPSGSMDTHVSNGESDAFLSKFGLSGNYVWSKTWGGSGSDRGYDLSADNSGNTFRVTGAFVDVVDFDPGVDTEEHTSNGSTDVYLTAYAFNGDFQWAKTWGGGLDDNGYGVVLDPVNRIYTAGSYSEIVDFNTGPGLDIHISNGETDAFLTRCPFDGVW